MQQPVCSGLPVAGDLLPDLREANVDRLSSRSMRNTEDPSGLAATYQETIADIGKELREAREREEGKEGGKGGEATPPL